jgi:hypothetical protein
MPEFQLKITSAVVIDGDIKVAGSIVTLGEDDAKDLLRREKAVLDYSVQESAAVADEAPADPPAAAPEAPAGDAK